MYRVPSKLFYKFSTFLFPVVAAIAVINMLDLPWELRFSDQAKNYLFVVILCYLLPISSGLWALSRPSKDLKVIGIVVCLSLSILCFITQLFAYSSYEDVKESEVDYSFEKIQEEYINGRDYVLYRTNGGATTSYGLVLREEIPLLFDFKLVHTLHSKYKASVGEISTLESGKLQLIIQPYSDTEKVDILEFEI